MSRFHRTRLEVLGFNLRRSDGVLLDGNGNIVREALTGCLP
jgi:hypothetical protein